MPNHVLNKNHPELKEGEVWLTNASDEIIPRFGSTWESISWKSKRRGICAYDAFGVVIQDLFPVFVKKEELIKAGMNLDRLWK